MPDVLTKLESLATLSPTPRRADRVAALLLQCDEERVDEAIARAVDLELISSDALRRVRLVRRNFEETRNPRWMFMAFKHLQASLRPEEPIHAMGSAPDDAEDGATWVAPDDDDAGLPD